MLLVPSASPFEIYDTSTALLRKFQSSTYHRYASGWNLLGALYLHRLFQKAYGRAFFRTDRNGRGSTQKRVSDRSTGSGAGAS